MRLGDQMGGEGCQPVSMASMAGGFPGNLYESEPRRADWGRASFHLL